MKIEYKANKNKNKAGIIRSNSPFRGAYNRCYIDKKGEYKRMYTNEESFGTYSGANFTQVVLGIMLSIFIAILVSILLNSIDTRQADGEIIIVISTFISILLFSFGYITYDIKRCNEAYSYFKEHPDKLNNNKMAVRDICPECGTQNNDYVNCTNCGKDLSLHRKL